MPFGLPDTSRRNNEPWGFLTNTGVIDLHPKHPMVIHVSPLQVKNKQQNQNMNHTHHTHRFQRSPNNFNIRPHNTSCSFHPSSPGVPRAALRSPGRGAAARPDTAPSWRGGGAPAARPPQHRGTGLRSRGSSAGPSGGSGPSNGRPSWYGRDAEQGRKLGWEAWSQS